jgi:hypothetical protein
MNAPTSVRLKADPTTLRRRSSDGLSPNCPGRSKKWLLRVDSNHQPSG